MLHFQYIEYLVTLALVPLMVFLYYAVVRWKKNTAKKIGDPALVNELTSTYSSKKFSIKFILFAIAFALCAFAVAGLAEPDGTQKINRKGTDIMIALDVSKSMLAQDVKPNRLERAKQVISRLIGQSPEDRIGLVIFAGRAYLQMPLTVDHAAAKMYLSAASPNDVPSQGTVISQALKMCSAAFNPKDKTFKSVLLISDGEDHDEEALKVTRELAKQGIMVNTVGIGSPQGAPIMDPETGQYKTDEKGQTVITKLNEEELSNIAKTGNGIYQLYSNTDAVAKNIRNKLSTISQISNISDSSYASFKQYFQYILGSAFILLLIEFFISENKKLKLGKTIAVLFLVSFGLPAFSQSAKSSIVKGNKAYKENKYADAEVEYREALKKSDNKNFTADYNLGNALYRKDSLDEAAKSYDKAIANTDNNNIKQQAFYNKGVAYQKAKKLPECITAYKNALLLNPNDEDARQNLQRALKEQQQQQQQNNKDNKDNKDKKDNKNQKKDQKDQQKKDQDKNQQPKPQPSKISKQDAEEKLKSLLENEKQLQEKLHKMKGAAVPNRPEKDW